MDIINGLASEIENSTSGGGTGNFKFILNGKVIHLKSAAPVLISKGDNITAAGFNSRDVHFKVLAYKNNTTGDMWNIDYIGKIIMGLVLLFIGLADGYLPDKPTGSSNYAWLNIPVVRYLVLGFLIIIGVTVIYQGVEVFRAKNMIKKN